MDMEQMEAILKVEMDEDQKITKLADTIREGMVKCFADSLGDEDSPNDIKNVLLEDDHLQEELIDRVACLNILEAAAAGRLQKGNAGNDTDGQEIDVTEEELEQAYLLVMDSMFQLSKIDNPLSGMGRDRLEAGVSLIREFEKLYWPLSTKVTEENIDAFKELLSEEQYLDVLEGGKRAIGALRHMGEDVVAAGIIVYTVPQRDELFIPRLSLDWIEVAEELRERGVGNFLMAEFLGLALQNEGMGVETELPVLEFETEEEEEEAAALYGFLDEWGFGFNISAGTHFAIQIRDMIGNKMINLPTEAAEPLGSLGARGEVLLFKFFDRLSDLPDPGPAERSFSYFDRDISTVILEKGKIVSALLFHSYPGGNIRYEGYYAEGRIGSADVAELSGRALHAAIEKGNEDSIVFGSFSGERGRKVAARLIPNARCPMYYAGSIDPDDEAFTTEEWEGFRERAGLSSDMIPDEGIEELSGNF